VQQGGQECTISRHLSETKGMRSRTAKKILPALYILGRQTESEPAVDRRSGIVSMLAPTGVHVSPEHLQWEHVFRSVSRCIANSPSHDLLAMEITSALWRFVKSADIGDYVIDPGERALRVGRIVSAVDHVEASNGEGVRYFRRVHWLTREPIPAMLASFRLQVAVSQSVGCSEYDLYRRDIAQLLVRSRGVRRRSEAPIEWRDRLREIHTRLRTLGPSVGGLHDFLQYMLCVEFRAKEETVLFNDGNHIEAIVSGTYFEFQREPALMSVELHSRGRRVAASRLIKIAERMSEYGVRFAVVGVLGDLADDAYAESQRIRRELGLQFVLLDGYTIASLLAESSIGEWILKSWSACSDDRREKH